MTPGIDGVVVERAVIEDARQSLRHLIGALQMALLGFDMETAKMGMELIRAARASEAKLEAIGK